MSRAEVRIRPLRPDDLPHIAALLRSQPQAAPWLPTEDQFATSWVAETSTALVGLVVLRQVAPDEWELLNVAVAPGFLRDGIASCLLETGLRPVAGDVFLEVRAGNLPARRLYEKFGFVAIARRPHYYENPPEDALVMKLSRPPAET